MSEQTDKIKAETCECDTWCDVRHECKRDEDGCNAHCEPHQKGEACDIGADDCPTCVPVLTPDRRCPVCRQRDSRVRVHRLDDGARIVWTCNVKGCENHADTLSDDGVEARYRYAIEEALHVLEIGRDVDVSVAKTWLKNALAGVVESGGARTMQRVLLPMKANEGPGETRIATLRLPVSVKSMLCITEGLTLEHGKGLVMRQIEDSLVIFKPNVTNQTSSGAR